ARRDCLVPEFRGDAGTGRRARTGVELRQSRAAGKETTQVSGPRSDWREWQSRTFGASAFGDTVVSRSINRAAEECNRCAEKVGNACRYRTTGLVETDSDCDYLSERSGAKEWRRRSAGSWP